MGALMCSIDWSRTHIASVESWSPVLRMMVRFLLSNRVQCCCGGIPNFARSATNHTGRCLKPNIHNPSVNLLAIAGFARLAGAPGLYPAESPCWLNERQKYLESMGAPLSGRTGSLWLKASLRCS